MFNQVTDNHIHHCGVFNKYVAGVFLGVSDGNLVVHNRIEDMPASAINLGQNSFGKKHRRVQRDSPRVPGDGPLGRHPRVDGQ